MTHLRLLKEAERCWELNLGVPVPGGDLAHSALQRFHVGHCCALPLAFDLSLGPWTLKRVINAINLFQEERVIYLEP